MKNRPLALLLCLFLQSSLTAQTTLTQKVDALAAAELAKPGGVGLSIAIAQRGKVLLSKGYGTADAEFDVPANELTMFRIGSVTKQFTAALVLQLVEQTQLALDDLVEKYVPEFPYGGRKVTIQQLLQHTSGIKSYTEINEAWKKVWPLELSHAELLALVKDAPFDFEPGSDWRYSNTGYYLLGMVIEKVAGKSYAEVLLAQLCTPLGLARTRYDSNRDLIKNRAQGYSLVDDRLANDEQLGMAQPGAAGGIVSTAGDLVRWQMALSTGKVVKPESFEKMRTTVVLPSGRDTHYGFGLALDEWEGRPRVGHGGGIHGFNSKLYWLPKEDLHVAVISNGEELSSGKLAEAIAYAALGIERAAVKDDPIPADLLARLPGEYSFTEIGMDLKVFEREGKLMLQGSGQGAFRVLWQGELDFRAEFDTDVKVVFAADAKSLVIHQGGKKTNGVRK